MFSLGQLISTLGGTVFLRLCGAMGGLTVQILLARTLDSEDMGTFFMATSASELLALAYIGGYGSAGLTYLSRYISLGRKKLQTTFITAALRDLAYNMTVLTILVIVVLSGLSFRETTRQAIFLGLIVAPAVAIMSLQSTIANVNRYYYLAFAPDYFIRPLAFLVAVSILLMLTDRITLTATLAIYALLAYSTMFGQIYFLAQREVSIKDAKNWFVSPDKNKRKRLAIWRSRASSLVIVTLVSLAFSDLVVLVAGLFLETGDVAIIGVSVRIAVLVGFAGQICHQLVIPDLTSTIKDGDYKSRQRILLRANYLSIIVPVITLILALIFGEHALSIFGSEYASGYYILIILLLSPLIRSSCGMNVYLLSLDGKQAHTGLACAISVFAMLISAGCLSVFLGPIGIAIGVVISDLCWTIGIGILARTKLKESGDLVYLLVQKMQINRGVAVN